MACHALVLTQARVAHAAIPARFNRDATRYAVCTAQGKLALFVRGVPEPPLCAACASPACLTRNIGHNTCRATVTQGISKKHLPKVTAFSIIIVAKVRAVW